MKIKPAKFKNGQERVIGVALCQERGGVVHLDDMHILVGATGELKTTWWLDKTRNKSWLWGSVNDEMASTFSFKTDRGVTDLANWIGSPRTDSAEHVTFAEASGSHTTAST
jgi:hypothetical protein